MMTAPPSALGERIATMLAIDPSRDVLEFDHRWWTWGQLADTADQVAALMPEPGTQVGVLLRNRPSSVGLLLGVLQAGGCVVTVNPGRGVERTRDDLAELDLSVVAGEPADVDALVADDGRATRITLDALGEPLVVRPGNGGAAPIRPGIAVRMLTSGTTGPPKRIDLSFDTLERVLVGAKHYESHRATEPRLRSSVAVVNSPLVHLGGLFRVLMCISDGRPFSFLERFTVEGWADAVRRHRPATASLVPAALRMVLEADLDPADLSSLRSVVSGTAPLSPEDADAFFEKYRVPVLIAYAATEFGGGVAGWTIDDHRTWWATKRGSVGRAHPGCELRVVDADTGAVQPPDHEGLLEVRTTQLGDDADWIRTTDLARLDDDGFLFILGRADMAIIRGGFKVLPDDVRAALERHPGVRFAGVVGRPDARLGAVPVAMVELREDAGVVTAEDLLAHASGLLARYELPAEIHIVDELPRTPAGKPDLAAVSDLVGVRGADVAWSFGAEPLPQTTDAADLLRRLTGLVLSMEQTDDEVARLIEDLRRAEAALADRVPASDTPRVGAAADGDGRVYLDHSRHMGAFNAGIPTYEMTVDGDVATGTVHFPIAYEGPPGIVHGGFLAVFFDSAMQRHNCEVGLAGKTTSLSLRYRRPTPLVTDLTFELAREVVDGRIRSTGSLFRGDDLLCAAEMDAVAGNRDALPACSPRKDAP